VVPVVPVGVEDETAEEDAVAILAVGEDTGHAIALVKSARSPIRVGRTSGYSMFAVLRVVRQVGLGVRDARCKMWNARCVR
jgi:hypothetical protein